MKKKYLAITMGLVLGASLMAGCGTDNTSSNGSADAEVAETVYGEISEIDGDTLTVKVGTQKEMEDADDGSTSESTDSDDSSAPEMPSDMGGQDGASMLDYTGEELEITVSDDVEITKQSMGGGMGQGGSMPGGDMSGGEAPSGDGSGTDGQSDSSDDSVSGADGSGSSDDTQSQQTPPEKPDGESDDSNFAPEMSGGEAPSGDAGSAPDGDNDSVPEKPDGESESAPSDDSNSSGESSPEEETIDFDDLAVGDVIAISYDAGGNILEITVIFSESGMGGNMQSSGVDSYDAATEYTEDTEVDGETFTSTGTDENAIHVYNGATVSIKNSTITRTSSDSAGGDNSSFYGVGAALLTTEGTTYVSDTTIETDAAGGAGIFSYGDGVTYVADSTITTKQDTSGGIHVAGGGTLYAYDLTVETDGASSAAIRSDRGSGTMVVDGGTYTSNGTGSPAVYSTADISVNDATLTANGSEAICIEGLNSIRLFDCDLTGNMADDDQNDCTWNVILYQSMSGDSEEGNSTFSMSGGTLTAKNGGMFYTTNTESTFTLSNVDITYADENDFFLRCTGNNNQRGWGTSGSNGADCLFTAIDQEMEGDVIWDSISQLDFYMTDGSTLTGAVVDDETYAGDGGNGYCNLYIEKGCTWTVTGDSTLSSLSNAGTIVDGSGKTVTIKGTGGTVYVNGTSSYKITVDSYSTTADLSGANAIPSWSDYAVSKPGEL